MTTRKTAAASAIQRSWLWRQQTMRLGLELDTPGALEVSILSGHELTAADPNGLSGRYTATPLFMASQQGHLPIVVALLAAGAPVDYSGTKDNCSPLFIACQQDHTEIAAALIGAGADVLKASDKGVAPLFLAAKKGNMTTVKALLDAKASVDQTMANGRTPLYIAAQGGHPRVRAQQPYRVAPLHYASDFPRRRGRVRMAALGLGAQRLLHLGHLPLKVARAVNVFHPILRVFQ